MRVAVLPHPLDPCRMSYVLGVAWTLKHQRRSLEKGTPTVVLRSQEVRECVMLSREENGGALPTGHERGGWWPSSKGGVLLLGCAVDRDLT